MFESRGVSLSQLEANCSEFLIPFLDARANLVSRSRYHVTLINERQIREKFVFASQIGSGASANIFLCYNHSSRNPLEPFALKQLKRSSFEGTPDEFEELVVRETTALEVLSRNKPKCSVYFTEYFGSFFNGPNKDVFLLLENCVGGPLNRLYGHEEKPKFQELASIASSLLSGLAFLHKSGLCHGDIKSANILVTNPGLVKIADFGLCISMQRNEYLHALGTLDWEAPELLLRSLGLDNQNPNVYRYLYDYKIDVWAVGILLLELVLGRTPLSMLRKSSADAFSNFIARMAAHRRKSMYKGSALGLFFYLPRDEKMVIQRRLNSLDINQVPERNYISDLDLLCKRYSDLGMNRKHLLQLLTRSQQFGTIPDPASSPAASSIPKLRTWNQLFDLISLCLFCNYRRRPSAEALLKHCFIRSTSREWKGLEVNIQQIRVMYKSRKQRKLINKRFRCSLTLAPIQNLIQKRLIKQKTKLFLVQVVSLYLVLCVVFAKSPFE
eukprot:snap_masked-scaffold_78-processed-gene-0.34-mRNA-1 protein AED:0.43 eAED:0.43 QI:0/0/0/0.5/1/1/2/0/497